MQETHYDDGTIDRKVFTDQLSLLNSMKEATENPKVKKIIVTQHIGRNDPCPCSSGKKFKKCCGASQ